jgi:hypothetical protein
MLVLRHENFNVVYDVIHQLCQQNHLQRSYEQLTHNDPQSTVICERVACVAETQAQSHI